MPDQNEKIDDQAEPSEHLTARRKAQAQRWDSLSNKGDSSDGDHDSVDQIIEARQADLLRHFGPAEDKSAGRTAAIAERRTKLFRTFDLSSAQGVLPLTHEDYHEQANPIVRSALFAAIKSRGKYDDWEDIFSLGGMVKYKGPQLTVDHEELFTRILVKARGRSLTKPVPFRMTEALGWLKLKDSGPNRTRVRTLLDDLKEGSVRIASKSALNRLYNILTRQDLEAMPDGKFLKQFVMNRYSEYLPMIMQSYQDSEPFEIDLDFIGRTAMQPNTRLMMAELDPMMALIFDGVNTTLVPFEIWDTLDSYGKKLLPFVASHRDGVFRLPLKSYHCLSGSKSSYESVERRFKSDFNKRLQEYEEKGWIEPGWVIVRSREHIWMVDGLKGAAPLKIKSELHKGNFIDPAPETRYDYDDDEAGLIFDHELATAQQSLL
jgi:hypothetical protein